MIEAIYDDDENIVCPDCGSPERNETDAEPITILGKKSVIYHFNCLKCGRIYYVRKQEKED
jgi:DNA-directed RNA polymerase subunit RPC12/RpoP